MVKGENGYGGIPISVILNRNSVILKPEKRIQSYQIISLEGGLLPYDTLTQLEYKRCTFEIIIL